MRTIDELQNQPKLKMDGVRKAPTMELYAARIRLKGQRFLVLWSYNEDGYEHVSISHGNTKVMPTWEQMCELKEVFFYPEEMAVQIHPRESEYVHGVGNRGNVLHLWRPIGDRWEILDGQTEKV